MSIDTSHFLCYNVEHGRSAARRESQTVMLRVPLCGAAEKGQESRMPGGIIFDRFFARRSGFSGSIYSGAPLVGFRRAERCFLFQKFPRLGSVAQNFPAQRLERVEFPLGAQKFAEFHENLPPVEVALEI